MAEWKMWREQQVWEVPGRPRGILGEAASRRLEKGPENSGEKSGLEEAAPETFKEEETSLLRGEWRVIVNHPPVGWMWPADS